MAAEEEVDVYVADRLGGLDGHGAVLPVGGAGLPVDGVAVIGRAVGVVDVDVD